MNISNKNQNEGITPFFCGEDTKCIATNANNSNSVKNTTGFIPCGIINTPQESETPPQSWLNDAPPIDYDNLLIPNDFDDSNLNPENNDGLSDPDSEYSLDSFSGTKQEERVETRPVEPLIPSSKPVSGFNVVHVRDRYALDGIKQMIDMGETSIRSHADMKSGKTYTVGWLAKNHLKVKTVIYISHLISINKSTAIRLSKEFGIDFVSYQDLQ
jgi:hypothetical protein